MRFTIDRNETSPHGALVAGALVAALALSLLAPAVATAEEDGGAGSVGATVTASDWPEACIIIQATTLDFGELRFSRADQVQSGKATVDGGTEENYQIVSCSDDEQGILVAGTHATGDGPVEWSLVASLPSGENVCSASDQYRHGLEVRNPATEAFDSGMVLLSTNNTGLPYAGRTGTAPSRLEAGGERTLRNTIWMPCEGSAGSGVAMAMDVQFTALLDD